MAFASIKASAKAGKDFEPVPAGVHFALCTQVVDLGLQPGSGKYPRPKHQVYLKFEIPDVKVEWEKDGEKHEGSAMIGRKFGLTLSDKSHLKPFLVSWRGKPFTATELESFDITSVIGKVCQLNVVHEAKGDGSGKVYANISNAFPLIREQIAALNLDPSRAKPSQELLVYTPAAHDQKMWERLPEWMQEAISKRVEEAPAAEDTSQAPANATEEFNDDIPF